MAKKKPAITVEKAPERQLSADRTGRFALDALLRKNGFIIHARKPGKEPLWSLQGKLYTERQAVATLDKNDVEDARYQGILCGEGLD